LADWFVAGLRQPSYKLALAASQVVRLIGLLLVFVSKKSPLSRRGYAADKVASWQQDSHGHATSLLWMLSRRDKTLQTSTEEERGAPWACHEVLRLKAGYLEA